MALVVGCRESNSEHESSFCVAYYTTALANPEVSLCLLSGLTNQVRFAIILSPASAKGDKTSNSVSTVYSGINQSTVTKGTTVCGLLEGCTLGRYRHIYVSPVSGQNDQVKPDTKGSKEPRKTSPVGL